ncbi:MAG: cellulase family glycosylhydrolase [Paludibacteraceae bacterium]|nr:cellulase family glycosylhydrolase [Paludibacteraceae bacterium]
MRKILLLALLAIISPFYLLATDFSSNNYIQKFGMLQLVNNQLSDSKGDTIQLKGWSVSVDGDFKNSLGPEHWKLMKSFGANVVRLAINIDKTNGYLLEQTTYKERIKQFIKETAAIGIYCIVDWDLEETKVNTANPNDYITYAEDFFTEISQYCADNGYDHVIYEICNDPVCGWPNIKNYAEQIIPEILAYQKDAIIIVGTDAWCQKIIEPASSPLNNAYKNNVMYAFSYFACSHYQLTGDFQIAKKSIPVFVTSWSGMRFDLEAPFCRQNSEYLLYLCDNQNSSSQVVSWCALDWASNDSKSSFLHGYNSECKLSEIISDDETVTYGKFLAAQMSNGEYNAEEGQTFSFPITFKENKGDTITDNYIQKFGKLQLLSNQLSDSKGNAIQLKGWSVYVDGDFRNCLGPDHWKLMKSLGANVVRLAIKLNNKNGYLLKQDSYKDRIKKFISETAAEGMYCIVDWDLEDEKQELYPNDYITEAKDFFTEISKYCSDNSYDHVIYEICNQPSTTVWADIVKYAESVISDITKNQSDAIIIVGTSFWCQNILEPVMTPIKSEYQKNVMYSFSYYACSHYSLIGDFRVAQREIPVFATWTGTKFDLQGPFCRENTDDFILSCEINAIAPQLVSWCTMDWASKDSKTSFLIGDCSECKISEEKDHNGITYGRYIASVMSDSTDFERLGKTYSFPQTFEDDIDNENENEKDTIINNDDTKQPRLKLIGIQLSYDGKPIQLTGRQFTLNENSNGCLGQEHLQFIKKGNANVVRFAMNIGGEGNYLSKPAEYKEIIKKYIKQTADEDIFCIVDWNIYNQEDPNDYINQASEFFFEISKYCAENNYNHVIYEICGEPGGIEWKDIKSYAETVIPEITINQENAIIIVGTAFWCQKILEPVANPISKEYLPNVMYSFHYSACSHFNLIGDFRVAQNHIPVFASEWYSGSFDRSITNCNENTNEFLRYCLYQEKATQIVSNCEWNDTVLPNINCSGEDTDIANIDAEISLYYNTNSSELSITLINDGTADVEVINSIGQVVASKKVEKSATVNKKLPAGIYTVVVKDSERSTSKKLVIQ